MGVSKVVYGNQTIMDISGDTVNANNLLAGETAHGADGERVVGALVPTGNNIIRGYAYSEPITNIEAFIARVNQLSDFSDITYASNVFSGKTINAIFIACVPTKAYILLSDNAFDIATYLLKSGNEYYFNSSRKTSDGSSHSGYKAEFTYSNGIQSLTSITISGSWEADNNGMLDNDKEGWCYVTENVQYAIRSGGMAYKDRTSVVYTQVAFYEDAERTTPITPEIGYLYVDITSKLVCNVYIWNGTDYILVGTTDYEKLGHKPSINDVELIGNKTLSELGITKSAIGLGNVANTGDSATPVSGGTTKFTTGGAYTELNKKYDVNDTAETAIADADYFPFYDTSATAKRKTLWSNIKAKLKTYFDTLYTYTAGDGINVSQQKQISTKNMQSGDMAEIITPLPSTRRGYQKYSTDEQVIGEWIDGKSIYQKTIDFGAMPNATSKSVAHNISNLDKTISLQGCFKDTNGNMSEIPFIYPSDVSYNIGIYASATNIIINTATDRSSQNAYVTIQYTKTTS